MLFGARWSVYRSLPSLLCRAIQLCCKTILSGYFCVDSTNWIEFIICHFVWNPIIVEKYSKISKHMRFGEAFLVYIWPMANNQQQQQQCNRFWFDLIWRQDACYHTTMALFVINGMPPMRYAQPDINPKQWASFFLPLRWKKTKCLR